MSIEVIAINYGEPRYGRSCANCNCLKQRTMGYECGVHLLPTKLNKCCGTWIGERVKQIEEKQGELF